MATFWEMLVLAGLVCGGVTVASRPGGFPPLARFRKWLDVMVEVGRIPQWIADPILLCDTCMASVWGIPIFSLWALMRHGMLPMWVWWIFLGIAFVCGLALLNFALWTVLKAIEKTLQNDAHPRKNP